MTTHDITVWVAVIKGSDDDGRDVSAWSRPDKAKGHITRHMPVEVEWRDVGGRKIAEIAGEVVGTVRQAPVADPTSLAQQYPDELPSVEFIPPDVGRTEVGE